MLDIFYDSVWEVPAIWCSLIFFLLLGGSIFMTYINSVYWRCKNYEIQLLEELLKKHENENNEAKNIILHNKATVKRASDGSWICSQCGAKNEENSLLCKDCGKYR